MNRLNILIAEDHGVTAKLLSRMLSQNDCIHIAGIASNGKEAIEYIRNENIDLVLLDIHLPYIDGIRAMDIILKEKPDIKILILSSDNDSRIISKSLQLGALGYLNKTAAMDEIMDAIIKVAKGEKYLSIECMKALVDKEI